MIKADHNKLAHLVFSLYLKSLLKSSFKEFIIINELPMIDNSKGLIVTPNHFSWWDGFFIEYLMRKFSDRKLYIMMLEDQLKKYPFFKYLGACSIKPGSVRSVSESIVYSKEVAKSD